MSKEEKVKDEKILEKESEVSLSISKVKIPPVSLQEQLKLKEKALKTWKMISAIALVLTVVLAYFQSYDLVKESFFPPEPSATKNDVENIADDRYVAQRGLENQAENSLRLMEVVQSGYVRKAIELVNIGNQEQAISVFEKGYAKEKGIKISREDSWEIIVKKAELISPSLGLKAYQGSIKGKDLDIAERLTYTDKLKSAGIFGDALQQANQAINLSDKANDPANYFDARVAKAHVLYELGDFKEASKIYRYIEQEMYSYSGETSFTNLYSGALNGLGLILHLEGSFEQAIEKFELAAQLSREARNWKGLASVHSNMARSARRTNDNVLTEAAYNSSIALSLFTGQQNTLLNSVSHLTSYYNVKGYKELGLQTGLYGVQEARRLGIKHLESQFLQDLVVSYGIFRKESVPDWIERLQKLNEDDPTERTYRNLQVAKAYVLYHDNLYVEARTAFEKLPDLDHSKAFNDAWKINMLVKLDLLIGDQAMACSRMTEFDVIVKEMQSAGGLDISYSFKDATQFRNSNQCQ